MVISKRIDYRRRKKREIFFGMPFLPLAIFLLLVLILLVIPPMGVFPNPKTQSSLGLQTSDNVFGTAVPITGEVVGGFNLTKTSYSANEDLSGTFILRFYPGDMIPYNSAINFSFSSVKCNYYYACSFANFTTGEGIIRWEIYNKTSKRCVNATEEGWLYGPWENCGENYAVFNCSSPLKCCDPGKGIGGFYANLQCSGNKECWDKCSSIVSKPLYEVIFKSTTPWNGNYSLNGSYYNVNATTGNQLNGSGPGFGYCYTNGNGGSVGAYGYGTWNSGASGAYSWQRSRVLTGYATESVPQPMPDLIVTKIYISDSSSQPPTGEVGVMGSGGSIPIKYVYATIQNIGNANANNFVVRAEWNSVPYMPGLGNYKEISISLAANAFYDFQIMPLESMRDQELSVFADYYNVTRESNENNNIKKAYLGCYDYDGGNDTSVKAKCIDFSDQYLYEDYCFAELPSYHVVEYTCGSPGGPGGPGSSPGISSSPEFDVCIPNNVYCENGCEDGRCKEAQPPQCYDTDKGLNPEVAGACYEGMPPGLGDTCIDSSRVQEYYCKLPEDKCSYLELYCQNGLVCIDGACVVPPKPDLIIERISRTADTKNALITIKNIGNGTVNQSFNLLINISLGVNATELIPITSSLGPGASYSKASNTNIEGKTVAVYAYVDVNNSVPEDNEGNNIKAVQLLPYSCENWNNPNVYYTSLKNLGLKAPEYAGVYTLNMVFYYQNKIIDTDAVNISVSPTVLVRRCSSSDTCVQVSCNPETQNCTDRCSSNADCRSAQGCYENWQYTSWTDCIQGKMQRECYDARHCGTTEFKPASCIQIGNKYIEVKDCCVPSWQCDEWSACYEYQGASIQSMTCSDLNRCNPQNASYTQVRDCCQEEWSCTWGPCINGIETLTCQELNGCGTSFTKPQEQSRRCSSISETKAISWWVILVIIIAVIVVTIVVLLATNVIKVPKKAKAETSFGTTEAGIGAGAVSSTGTVTAAKYPELTNYIKSALAAGMGKEEIKRKLIEAGWPEDLVNSELSKI